MLKTLYKISTYLVIALGIIHVLFTIQAYGRWTLNAMWFLGAGLALIFAGFLNLILIRDKGLDPVVRLLCLIADTTCFLLFGAALFLLTEPQVYVGLALFAFESVGALIFGKTTPAPSEVN